VIEVLQKDNNRKVHATQAIEKGTEICKFTGELIDYKKTLELGNKESFALQIEKDVYIFLDEPFRYFNHSCEPNCGLTPELKLITLKDIDKNEELRYDYSTTMLEHHWTMKCECKKPNCRKIITDFDKLPKVTQKKYIDLNIVQDFIIRELKLRK
jgi:SET domain-containing protein